jgi:hypothetical protein
MTPIITFEEKQVNPRWAGWLAVFFGMGLVALLLYRVAELWEAAGGELTDTLRDLLGGAAGMSIAMTVVAWMVFSIQLKVTVDREGLTYFYFPMCYMEKRIDREDIASFEIRKMSFMEYLKFGGSRTPFRLLQQKKEICVLNCWTVVDLTLNDGRKVILGTSNPGSIERALNRLLTPAA